MTPIVENIIARGNANRILDGGQLARAAGGGEDRRYRQVRRALKSGELLRLRRDLYVLAPALRDFPPHPFVLAQHLAPGSFVSAESALAWHGWIPEAVFSVLSVVCGMNSFSRDTESFGHFEFRRMTTRKGWFLQGVERVEFDGQPALLAGPMRALMDLVALRKLEWQGLDFLHQGLRIDETSLAGATSLEIATLLDVYKGRRERDFIHSLMRALGL